MAKILVHDYGGYAFSAQLGRELAGRGYDVLYLYYGGNNTPKGRVAGESVDPVSLRIEALQTRRLIQKYNYLMRSLQEIEYGIALVKTVKAFQPDHLLVGNTPLLSLAVLARAAKRVDTQYVTWLHDLRGIAAFDLLKNKYLGLGRIVGWLFIYLEKRFLRQSDKVVLITRDFEDKLQAMGLEGLRTTVIPNWAPLDELPVREKNNPWTKKHGLGDKCVFLYAGGMGLKHNPGLLLRLAQKYKDVKSAAVVVVSEGAGADWLQAKKVEYALTNLILLGYQPYQQMPEVLAAGDVLMAVLEPEASQMSVPSKVLAYLCAGRPLLLAMPAGNLAARTVSGAGAGFVVEPDDIEGFLEGAGKLYADQALREEMGGKARRYAEDNFDIQRVADRFVEVFGIGE